MDRVISFGCPICGLALPAPGPCPNLWCQGRDREFSVVFALGAHDWQLRHAIGRYKYRRQLWLSGVFARMLAGYLSENPTWFEEFDVLTSMPAYLGPDAARDWDPVGAILSDLRPLVEPGWAVVPEAVVKTFETPCMQGRSWADRQRIAAGPLRRSLQVVQPEAVSGARILILDDVLTEGGTLREVARVLKRAGALEVAGLVLARPVWT